LIGFISVGYNATSLNQAKAAEKNDYATVIMYHRFGESRYPSTNVTIEQFESHLEFIRQGNYTVMPLIKIIEALKSGDEINDKTVAITIDDAYLSVYKEAWPRLQEYGYPFTIFIATDPVDNNLKNYMDWDQIRELQEGGVTIGSQTKSHPHMHRLSPIRIEQEIAISN
ncbi:MAG: polysaccharide deacetylase family protein, partial [Pseudomonadota bacterium]|nr:polysaccharide deacetylase family protein [Pseudomonadota bacterium]